jgi:hypothetical protein
MDCPAVRFDDRLADGKSQAHAALSVCHSFVRCNEFLKQAVFNAFVNPVSRIRHAEFQLFPPHRNKKADIGAGRVCRTAFSRRLNEYLYNQFPVHRRCDYFFRQLNGKTVLFKQSVHM